MCDDSNNSDETRPTSTEGVDPREVYESSDGGVHLRVVTGPDRGREARLQSGELEIGRSSDADLQLADGGISGLQCRLYREGESTYVEDLHSTNGTVVNGRLVREARELTDGDAIAIGEETLLRFSAVDAGDDDADSTDAPGRDEGIELTLGRNAYWFRVDSGEVVDLRKRGALRRILLELLENTDTLEARSVHDLFDVGWPDQTADPDSASSRVYWAIRTLRDQGLRDVLITDEDGYFIPDELVSVDRRPDAFHPPDS